MTPQGIRRARLGFVLVVLMTTALPAQAESPTASAAVAPALDDVSRAYPPTARQDIVDTLHGVEVADPYRWLEDPEGEGVAEWMDAQDAFSRRQLDQLPGRAALIERLRELSYIDDMSPPMRRGESYFYSRRHKDREKRVYYWRQGDDGAEQVLFDPNTWSEDGSVSMKGSSPSWDGKKVAYRKSFNNADAATLYVRDVATGEDLATDVIPGAKYAWPSWTPDSRGFYYVGLPTDDSIPASELPGHAELRFHRLGDDPAKDEVIFPALGDPKQFLNGGLSRDGRWLFVVIQRGWNATDLFIKDLAEDSAEARSEPATASTDEAHSPAMKTALEHGFRPFVVGEDARYQPVWWKDRFYIFTDQGAPKGRVVVATPDQIGQPDQWRELVAESDATLERAQVVGGHLVLVYGRNATSEILIRNLDGSGERRVEFPEPGSSFGLIGEPDKDRAYFYFASYTRPQQVYEMSVSSGESRLWSNMDLPVDSSKFKAEQVWYPSKDGTKVSMFIVARKDVELDGNNPTWLEGYGGFGVSIKPYFATDVATWVEQGGVYAAPNLRGGGEYGEAWHEAGMMDRKQNTFDDFIAAAEYLVKKRYTQPAKLAISGASNGGLLVGAAMTQRPDLFRAVLCGVPLLDMVRYHLFGSGKTWIPEYGSADDPEQFKTLYAYSPYHHVKKGESYPSLLMLAASHDDRVDPMHARKFVAAVQWASGAGDRPVLMRLERNAGHGGGDMVEKRVLSNADQLAFLMSELGLEADAATDAVEADQTAPEGAASSR
ncbi:MAG: prolyl oligopeptidase family serine peptidase [Acidobacteriota bacterium]